MSISANGFRVAPRLRSHRWLPASRVPDANWHNTAAVILHRREIRKLMPYGPAGFRIYQAAEAVFSTPFPIAGNSKQIPTLGRGKHLVESVAIHILDSPYQSLIAGVCVAHEQQYQDHADERNEPGHNHYRV